MKVVLYCCEFAPEGKTGAIRPTKLAKYFKKKDIDVSVIAKYCDNSQVHQSLVDDINDIPIKRIKIKKLLPINDDGFWFSLYSFFPLLTYVMKNKPDYVFVSIPVFLPALFATLICKITKTKLIVDYRDLWAGDPYSIKSKKDFLLRKVGKFVEPFIMKNCFFVNFISEAMKSDQEKIFGKIDNKTVFSTGYDSEDVDKVSLSKKMDLLQDNIHYFSHIGMLDWDMNIDSLVQLIRKQTYINKKTKFLFVGGKNHLIIEYFKKNEIFDYCEFIGNVDKKTALNIAMHSDGLIILGSDSAQRLNRKVFESIAVNSNIFYYGNKKSPTASVLRNCGHAYIYDSSDNMDKISAKFGFFLNGKNTRNKPPESLNKYNKTNIADMFLNKMRDGLWK
ncbi:hypothetical protein ACP5PY_01635 [Photobacterium leiognathi subsp. mandapamensis]